MKIGVDIRTLMDVHYSGVPEYTFSLLEEIFKLDHENEYRLFYNSLEDISGRMPDFRAENIRTVHTSYPNKILNYISFKALGRPHLDSLLGADMFFMPHMNFVGLSGYKKSVLTVHDLSFIEHPEFFSCRKNLWHRMVNPKKLLKKFSRIIAVSEHTKKDIVGLCGICPDKVSVIYSGIKDIFSPIAKTDPKLSEIKAKYGLPDKFILFLGTLEPRKNVDGLIKAYDELLKNNALLRNMPLVLAGGKGWKVERILSALENSPYKDNIRVTGYIDREDRPYLYNLAEIFVYPSFYEGFGFPPLEALACGLPVVTSSASSLPEVVGDAALLVDPYDINGIALAMEKAITDAGLRDFLREKGLQRAKHFNWKETAEKHLQIFKNL